MVRYTCLEELVIAVAIKASPELMSIITEGDSPTVPLSRIQTERQLIFERIELGVCLE